MGEPIYLGVDIGTTSAKCLAVSAGGAPVAFAQQPYPISHPCEGWAEQDPEDYRRALVSVVNQCARECEDKGRDSGDVVSLAMSTQGDTLIVTDAAGVPLAPAMSWMDTRADEECRELLAETGQDFWHKTTGISLISHNSACKIRWISRRNPDLRKRIRRFCYVPDFLAHRLCGRFVTDVPSASWSPMFSPQRRDWSPEAMEIIGVSSKEVACAEESGTIIGELLPEAARELHLSPATKLAAGAFDQAAAALGAGASASGRSVLSCGTAWVLYAVSDVALVDETGSIPVCCHAGASQWGMLAPFTGGAAYDWLNRTLNEDRGECGSGGELPIFIPHLYGGLSPDWRSESRGSILGLTMSHTPQDVRLALMNGLAFEARRNTDVIERLSRKIESIVMVGGASKSQVWPQIVADVLSKPIEVSGFTESACYGAAKLAAGHVSVNWPEPEPLRRLNPNPESVRTAHRRYKRYLRFYKALLPLYE